MATIIDRTLAKSLIKEYQTQNAAPGGPAIKTTDGHFLNGYFLDRKSLETILSNPNAAGVSLHLAKHPAAAGSAENQFTVLYAGAEANTAPGAVAPYVNNGDIYGDTPPCPPYCPSLI